MNTFQLGKHFKGRHRNGNDRPEYRIRVALVHLTAESATAVIGQAVGKCRAFRCLKFNGENIATFVGGFDIKDCEFVGNEGLRIERVLCHNRLRGRLPVAFQHGVKDSLPGVPNRKCTNVSRQAGIGARGIDLSSASKLVFASYLFGAFLLIPVLYHFPHGFQETIFEI